MVARAPAPDSHDCSFEQLFGQGSAGSGAARRGSQRKRRTATIAPPTPQAATTARSPQPTREPPPWATRGSNAAKTASTKWRTGKTSPIRGQDRVVLHREEHARDEQDREEDPVDDRGCGIGVRDDARDGDTERAERRCADHEGDDQRRPVTRGTSRRRTRARSSSGSRSGSPRSRAS